VSLSVFIHSTQPPNVSRPYGELQFVGEQIQMSRGAVCVSLSLFIQLNPRAQNVSIPYGELQFVGAHQIDRCRSYNGVVCKNKIVVCPQL